MTSGYPIVLTADRTLMADYPTLLDGMMGTVQTTTVPGLIWRGLLAPAMSQTDGRADRAPLGIRRIEATLLNAGFDPADVAVVTPQGLADAVGPATRVVGVASGDPLGRGMTNTTMVDMSGGELYTRRSYADLCRQLGAMRAAGADFRVIAGGPGAWQLANSPDEADRLSLDHIFVGYAERDAADVFGRLVAGETLDPIIEGRRTSLADIPPITAPTSMGVVEISRGCGRGCGFCTLATEPMIHLPVEQIVADAETNVRAGVRAVSLISEDLLRYGSPDTGVNPDAVIDMLAAVGTIDDLWMIQVDHINIASIMQYSDAQLIAVRNALRAGRPHEQVWVNLGVESASGELLAANGMGGKIHPFEADQWEELCEQAVRRMAATGFVPMLSLIMGLPGETDRHVQRTIDFVRRLKGLRAVVFPIFYAPLGADETPFAIGDMTDLHWRLFRLSYAFNFKWIPGMFADNHRASKAPWRRRAFIQTAGRLQTLQWKLKFIRSTGRLRP